MRRKNKKEVKREKMKESRYQEKKVERSLWKKEHRRDKEM